MSTSQSQIVMKSQRRKKLFAIEQFGGKCQLCGYNKCPDALEFHHLDPSTKEKAPSSVIFSRKWEVAFRELQKCILICANCHRELHHAPRDIDSLAPLLRPTLTIACKVCQSVVMTKLPSQQYCSSKCKHISERKVTKTPTEPDLAALIAAKTSWVDIGKLYGVSDNAIRKWARKFGLM